MVILGAGTRVRNHLFISYIWKSRLKLDISRQITVANDLLDADNWGECKCSTIPLGRSRGRASARCKFTVKVNPVDTNIANIQFITVDIVDEIDKPKLITAGPKAKTRRPNQIRQTEALLMFAAMKKVDFKTW
jgi:hypothetical protein